MSNELQRRERNQNYRDGWRDTDEHSEFLILPDGKILAHNVTNVMAGILAKLNPTDRAMRRRARANCFKA
jgi:hypothetical protein